MKGKRLGKLAFAFGLLLFLFFGSRGAAPSSANGETTIQLEFATFDPVIDGEPAVPSHLQANPQTAYVLIQMHGPLQPDWTADLQAAGVRVYGYLANYTYLAKLTGDGRNAVESQSGVRWVGSYHPAYKLSPTLASGRLAVLLFPDADVAQTAAAFQMAGAAVLEQNNDAGLIIVNAANSLIPLLAQNENVLWIQNDSQMEELNDDARWVSQGNVPFTTPLHDRGLTGAGQVAGAADSGLGVYEFGGNTTPNIPSCYFLDDGNNGNGGTPLPPGESHRKVIAYTAPEGAIGDTTDGTGHGSHVVGSIVGDKAPWNVRSEADGQAYEARVFFQDIGIGFPVGLINPPSDYRLLFEQAYDPDGDGLYDPANEPRTHSNSWGGADPIYSLETAQVDEFMWTHPDFLILFAAGNQGPGPSSIGQPATAKNIVTVGGTENGLADPNSMGYFSSHGPAPFGRMKPTLSAPGDRVTSAASGFLTPDPCGTTEKTGTSMATPTVQGIALLMRQYLWDGYYPGGAANSGPRIHPSSALLKGMLINSGRPMSGAHTDNGTGAAWPSNGQGWGRVTADDVLYFQGDQRALWLHDEYALDGSAGFDASGQTRTYTFTVSDSQPFAAEPVKVSLSWTDYPGLPPAGGALINNLDLVVTGPDGAVHIGNDIFSNDFNGLADLPPVTPDLINPWEVVFLENPLPGDYTVTVTAGNIASTILDPTRKQGFALVVTGDLVSEQGRAEIEYPEYEVNPADAARLRISDAGLNSNPDGIESVTAVVSNGAVNVTVTLVETAENSSVFAGEVLLTADGSAGLLAAPGDTIRLSYQDADNGQGLSVEAYDTAKIAQRTLNFINPPVLTDPGDTDPDGVYDLTWSPPENTDRLTGYIIQETTAFSLTLFDDAEGPITDNWTTGQPLTPWASDGLYQHSGSSAYWSGRGDILTSIDTALTLNHDVVVPAGLTSAQLSFYSRYYNDVNDYGHVEVSVGGGSWQRLRRLYADPRVVPVNGRFQYHQFDLIDYIGQSLRVRFRYDNGVASFPPDSPGWWIDDVVISGGSWQTIAVTGAAVTSYTVNGRLADQYFYRVRGLYTDGTVSGWSNVVDMVSEAATLPPTPEDEGHKTTGGGWLVTTGGKKINFGFNAQETADGFSGSLQLNDKQGNAKIHLNNVTLLDTVSGNCGGVPEMNNSLMFEGTGQFNGNNGASFRVCVQDNAEPGNGSDLFYLTCLSGCAYTTTGRVADNVIDGGNIQVRQRQESTGNNEPSSGEAATIILDPLLLSKGIAGQSQLFTVTVFDNNQDVLAGAPVVLKQIKSDGTIILFTGQSDMFGNVVFILVNLGQTTEYIATSNGVSSNSVDLDPASIISD